MTPASRCRRALVLAALAGCVDEIDPRWQLDHDHVVAVRATPPRIVAGETAALDALVAHRGAPTTIEHPAAVAAPLAPPEVQAMIGAASITVPPGDALPPLRRGLGLSPDAPVPVDLVMTFPRGGGEQLYVKKTVWLGAHVANPAVPSVLVDGAPAGDAIAIPRDTDVYFATPADDATRVSWLTSCGALFQDDVATSFLRATDPCEGELAVVVRSADGGVAWRVLAIRAE